MLQCHTVHSVDWYLDEWMMNWNVHRRKSSFPKWGNIPTFSRRERLSWLKPSWFLSVFPVHGPLTIYVYFFEQSISCWRSWSCEQKEMVVNILKLLHHVQCSCNYIQVYYLCIKIKEVSQYILACMLNAFCYHVHNITCSITSASSLMDEWWMGMYMEGSHHFLIEVISWHLSGGSKYPDWSSHGSYQQLQEFFQICYSLMVQHYIV
jgi:hypothetical protein